MACTASEGSGQLMLRTHSTATVYVVYLHRITCVCTHIRTYTYVQYYRIPTYVYVNMMLRMHIRMYVEGHNKVE